MLARKSAGKGKPRRRAGRRTGATRKQRVALNNLRPLRGLPAASVRRIAARALERVSRYPSPVGRIEAGTLSLTLCGDRFIRTINKRYLGRDEPTDVIAFSFLEQGILPQEEIGEVVVSTETAERQARSYGNDAASETIRLIVHGILHVFGYEHTRSQTEARKMRRREREISRRIERE